MESDRPHPIVGTLLMKLAVGYVVIMGLLFFWINPLQQERDDFASKLDDATAKIFYFECRRAQNVPWSRLLTADELRGCQEAAISLGRKAP